MKVPCSQALAKDSAGDLPLSGYCGGACTTAPRGGPGSWLPKGEQLGIAGAKAIDMYAFSWGVPRTPASNLIDTAQRKSQVFSVHRPVATGVELVHPSCACVPYAADAPCHGGGDHGPWLDAARVAVVAGAAASLGTTEAAWAPFAGPATPDRAVVLMTTVHCGATESDRHYKFLTDTCVVRNVGYSERKKFRMSCFWDSGRLLNSWMTALASEASFVPALPL